MKNIKDVSGRILNVGDPVCVLPQIILNKKIDEYLTSLPIGTIKKFCKNKTANIEFSGGVIINYNSNELSKINLKDTMDDIIVHLAQDIESLQLYKESEILNSMLNPLES